MISYQYCMSSFLFPHDAARRQGCVNGNGAYSNRLFHEEFLDPDLLPLHTQRYSLSVLMSGEGGPVSPPD